MKTLFKSSYGIKVLVLLISSTTSLHSLKAQFYKYSSLNTKVCDAQYAQSDPVSISDGNGGIIIAWSDYRDNSSFNLFAQRFNSKGEALWTNNGVPVCRMSGDQTSAVIVSDGNGGAIIAWIDTRSNYEIYAQKINSSGVRQWDTSGINVCSAGGGKEKLVGHSDYNGGIILSWADIRNGYDIIAQRVSSSGAVQWTSSGIEICTDNGDQTNPSICDDQDTAVIIAWDDARDGKKAMIDIFAQKLNLDGEVHWNTGGQLVCSVQEDQLYPEVCTDDSGGAFVVWQDKRSGAFDIYIQRLDESGTGLFTANGISMCAASNAQLNPVIVSDGSGGAIMTWRDQRNNSNLIYAQRINHAGTTSLANNGMSICSTSGSRENPNIISDNAGGAFILWSDTRSGNYYDLYIQRLLQSGSVAFANNGLLVSNGSNDQIDNAVCPDGQGGVIVAWTDLRNNSSGSDIYVQNVQKDGNLGIVPEITVKGNYISILDNDNSPLLNDHTDMGFTKTFSSLTKTFKIHNTGNDTLEVTGITISGTNSSEFSVRNFSSPENIIPGDSSSFDVEYFPAGIGVSNAVVNIANNDSNEATFNFAIKATMKAPKLEVLGNGKIIDDEDYNPSSDDSTMYGMIRNNAMSTRTFVLSSSGTDTLSITGISIGGTNASEFSFQPITYPRKLNGGKTMNLPILFNPTSLGAKVATVTITSSDPANGTYEFNIAGISVEPSILVKGMNRIIADGDNSPSVQDGTDNGKLRVSKSVVKKHKIHNTGTDALTVQSIQLSGSGVSNYSISTPAMPAIIGVGDSLSFDITYHPLNTGQHDAKLEITSDDPDVLTYDFMVTGTGILPQFVLSGNNKQIASKDTFPDQSDGTMFQDLRIGKRTAASFIIRNLGDDTLHLGNPVMTPYGPLAFEMVSNPDLMILPGDSSEFEVEFEPISRAQSTAVLSISTDDPNIGEYLFSVRGRGIEPFMALYGKSIQISDGSTSHLKENNTDYDSVKLENEKVHTFKLVNTGDDILIVNTIVISGADMSEFALESLSLPLSIGVGDSLIFGIKFKPTTIGRKTITVKISTDLRLDSEFEFELAGTAFEETIGLSNPFLGDITMFPNPCADNFYINIPNEVTNAKLTLSNSLGQVILGNVALSAGINQVSTENVKSGLIYVTIQTDGYSYRYKLVVRR